MKLHTLKPAEGSTKAKKRVGRGQGSGQVVLQQEDTKELNQDLVTNLKLVLKVVKCHCKEECLSLVSRTLTELNTRVLTLDTIQDYC